MDWYQVFLIAVFLLWVFSTPQDRNTLRVVLIASLFSEVIVDFITSQIHAPWKLVIPGAVEVLTIAALLRFTPTRTAYLNAGCLCVAWFAHLLCYLDVWLKTDIVYSRYETIIQIVAVGQLLACYDTVFSMYRRARLWASQLLGSRVRGVHAASLSSSSLHRPGDSSV